MAEVSSGRWRSLSAAVRAGTLPSGRIFSPGPEKVARVNRESERIPRRLRRGMRSNHKKDRIPYGRRSLQLAAGIFNPGDCRRARLLL